MTTRLNDFGKAIAEILQSMNLGLDDLNIKIPKGLGKQVCELLNLQKLKTERGREWKQANCSAFFERHHKDVMDLLIASDSITKLTKEKRSETRQPKSNQNLSDKISRETNVELVNDSLTRDTLPDAIKEEIRELVRSEVEKILINRTNLISSDIKYPMVPQAPLLGKKLSGKRVKMGVTVDEVLDELVMDAAKELRQTYGQIVDNALWLYFGKPLLSFQKDSDG